MDVLKLRVRTATLKFHLEWEAEIIQRCIREFEAFNNNTCNKHNEVIKCEQRQQ
jgi:hypothetical protein